MLYDTRTDALAQLRDLMGAWAQTKGYRLEPTLYPFQHRLALRMGAYYCNFVLIISGHKGDFTISGNSTELAEEVIRLYNHVLYPNSWRRRAVGAAPVGLRSEEV